MNRVNSNELLMSLAKNWPDAQIDGYIKELEEKRDEMADVIRDLKSMIKARNKKGRKLLDNGPRGGV